MDLPIRRALLSVSDKSGLLELARQLAARGIVLLSTGGTARALLEAGIAVREVADFTGFPEIMDGRVKTLHPKIHGGLLGRRGTDDEVMAREGILPIDLLVVNLYPFAATVARAGVSYEEAIENIDVGGPAMLRGAAKNHADVTVVVDPADYPALLAELDSGGGATRFEFRARLATKAFAHTATYDALVAGYLARAHPNPADPFPVNLGLGLTRIAVLRYGENPHQRAAFYRDADTPPDSIAGARFAQGKELSFNNIADADTALECVRQFQQAACVIVKHANPCGVAVAEDPATAYARAYRTDPTSAFGGIIAVNEPLDGHLAQLILGQQFVEVVVAPEVLPGAMIQFAAKPNVRVLVTGPLQRRAAPVRELRSVGGGVLAQESDAGWIEADDLECVTKRQPSPQERRDLLFAWRVCKFVKSNAIVFAREEATMGIGAGQMSRVYSSRIGAIKAEDAGLTVRGAVMASDAYFPFRDGVEVAARQGVTAVIQPGGSVRDAEVIAAANEAGIAMVFTGMRHFRH
ncbi:MAG TPA: bifunctional phosphoribosylaminoimidazolecarboxamide formyltransferase/IMP cyclohydrolase [Steroidobacteraceae bacterium]|nr:bifunctional phosphoribosylaminoimidazolecarboxamide formyltransferase/IMP cyclohydrolase [Steroidobacteraceae bacterium]